jgi:type II secretory pathway component GspD/PulD (secretin)
MKKLLFSLLLPLYAIWVSAQVPAGQDEAALPQPGAGVSPQEESFVGSLFSDPSEIENIEGLDEPLERVRLRDQDTNLILDMIQTITGRYILRPQNLPQVKINFDSMSVLTRRETLLALESLLAMNGIGITKIDSQFFKAVPATGINAHVPIWIDVPPSSLPPSQRIYVKMFKLKHVSAELMRETLNPFATPNVSSHIIEPVLNTITITDSLLNLQRIEKIISIMDGSKSDSKKLVFWHKTKRLSAEALISIFDSQWEDVWKTEFYIKPIFIKKTVTRSESGSSKQENNTSKPENRNSISISSSSTGILPENQLGIVCHAEDKQKLLGILDALDLKAQPNSDYVTFWYKPRRFSAETLSDVFLGQWSTLWVNEFTKQPRFMIPNTGDQLGITCHIQDRARIESIIEAMDVDIRLKFSSKLVPLYHASAEVVNKTVNELLGSLGGFTLGSENDDNNASQKKEQNPQGEDHFDHITKMRDVTFSEYALVVADSRSNGLFCFGTEKDIVKLKDLIKQLDTPLPMARIDTIFVMVDLSQANQRGIDALFQDLTWNDNERTITETVNVDTNGDNVPDSEQTNTYKSGAQSLTGGLKVPFLNSGLEFQVENWKIQQIKWNQIFSLASKREDVRIFSTPSITVSHGEQQNKGGGDSYIRISDERSIGLPGVTMNNGQTSQPNVDKLKASTELRVSNPRIRKTVRDPITGKILERGTVFMSVTVMAEKFDTTVSNTYEGQSLPSVKGRTAVTDLAIRDGQIMVLGGFQEVQTDEEISKYNFLSDIPYFGEKLFSPRQRKYTPTELMIFIKPTIIDPENPMDDYSNFNSDRIDSMMNPEYTPAFRSPSGKILGQPDKKSAYSKQDNQSSKPSL